MARGKRIVRIAAVILTGVAYVWVAAVRAAPRIRRRKEQARAARRRAAS